MIHLFKGTCVVLVLVCLGVLGYAIWNAFETAKRNRAAEEMSRQIFLAQMMQNKNNSNITSQAPANQATVKQEIVEPEKPKTLDYDKFENEVDLSAKSDKSLKDFFGE